MNYVNAFLKLLCKFWQGKAALVFEKRAEMTQKIGAGPVEKAVESVDNFLKTFCPAGVMSWQKRVSESGLIGGFGNSFSVWGNGELTKNTICYHTITGEYRM